MKTKPWPRASLYVVPPLEPMSQPQAERIAAALYPMPLWVRFIRTTAAVAAIFMLGFIAGAIFETERVVANFQTQRMMERLR